MSQRRQLMALRALLRHAWRRAPTRVVANAACAQPHEVLRGAPHTFAEFRRTARREYCRRVLQYHLQQHP